MSFELYVGGVLIQSGHKLDDLTLLQFSDIRKLCPYHSWVIKYNNKNLDISQYEPEIKLEEKTYVYFDGRINNVFKVKNGLGTKKFSHINDYEKGYCEKYITEMINKIQKDCEIFDGIVDNNSVSENILEYKSFDMVYGVSQYAPIDFMKSWVKILKNVYNISDISKDSFTINYESWCLGEPCIRSRIIKRPDILQIFNE